MYLFNKHIFDYRRKKQQVQLFGTLESKGDGSAKATANVTVEVIAAQVPK